MYLDYHICIDEKNIQSKTHVSEFKKINLSAVVFLYSVLRSVFE